MRINRFKRAGIKNTMEKLDTNKNYSEELFLTLKEIIKAENKSLKLLYENLNRQYEVLLNQKLTNFFEVLEEQRALVWEMQQKETIRQEELQKYLPDLEKISLKEIIHFSPEKYKQELEDQKYEFDLHVEKIETMKNRNQILIQKSLELIQQQLTHFRFFDQKSYDANGKIDKREVNLICKQV